MRKNGQNLRGSENNWSYIIFVRFVEKENEFAAKRNRNIPRLYSI
jgi:hypothetical protein